MITGDSPSSDAGRSDRDRTRLVKQAAAELGFERCGIAGAGPIPREGALLDWLSRGRAGSMAYMHRHAGSRRDVREWLPWARSVIVVALNYRRPAPVKPSDRPRGRVAMYAWGEDYHVVLRQKLNRLAEVLETRLDAPFQSRVCVDTSAIVERELAAMAGIGWIGKNTLVLHPALGSFFFLGEIITDLSLEADAAEPDHCGSCTRCLEACPTQAFPKPYEMDASRCISYLTIEHRGEIDPVLASKTDDWIFGCDVCQTVCPFNAKTGEKRQNNKTSKRQNVKITTTQKGEETSDGLVSGVEDRPAAGDSFVETVYPSLEAIEAWDAAAYLRAVRGKATKRAKLEMWRRNAEIVRGNVEVP